MEQNATLILLKHGNEEKEKRLEFLDKRLKELQSELEMISEKFKATSKENQDFSHENEKISLELYDAQLLLDKQTLKIAELQSNLNDLETIKTQLTLEREANRRMKIDLDLLQTNHDDQTTEMAKSREKEMELLQLNKELTETVVKLKNECSLSNSKNLAISLENETIKKDKKYYDDIISSLKKELEEEVARKADERQLMVKHISEKTLLAESLQKKLDCALDDFDAAKKKHSQSIKELNREIVQLRKKCDNYEAQLEKFTRNEGESSPTNANNKERDTQMTSTENSSSHASDSDSQSTHNEIPATFQNQEPSKKTLIDRIVRLQHAIARLNEKVDFLENHSANLVGELQKKSKLINYYMLREKSGALSSVKSDKNKVTNKYTFYFFLQFLLCVKYFNNLKIILFYRLN
jgi:chromosome segregation ATPase